MINRIKSIIKDKSGASLLFVLAVIFLLMAISTSALVAASASSGVGLNRHIKDQLDICADSVQKSVMYSLQTSDTDEDAEAVAAQTLGGKLLNNLYNEAAPSTPTSIIEFTDEVNHSFVPTIPGVNLSAITQPVEITIKPKVSITPEIPSQAKVVEEGIVVSPEILWEPQTVDISAIVTVSAKLSLNNIEIDSVVTYQLSGAQLAQKTVGGPIILTNAGDWRFVSHDKIEND